LISQFILAQKYAINGIVKDSITGETLIGANITIKGSYSGSITNQYGFYSISLQKGLHTLSASYIGYAPKEINVEVDKDKILNFNLVPQNEVLKEVIVTSSKSKIDNNSVSKDEVSINQIKTIPANLGVPDVLKVLQLMPGIQAVNEGSTNIYVRGGSFDQNLFLLDEAPVYNPAHALGFFSVFNTDVLKSVSVYKGGFPAHYGGRLSSVVDITMRDGNENKSSISAGIGLISSQLTLEGPIVKQKLTYIVSGRYSYPGAILNGVNYFITNDVSNNNDIWFYDLNTKLNLQVNDKNKVYFSMYSGHDNFYCFSLNNKNDINWGNYTSTFRWNHIFSKNLFSNYTLYYSKYNYTYSYKEDIRNFLWKSRISEVGLKADFSYYPNQNNTIRFGLWGVYRGFSPGTIMQSDSSSIIKNFSLDHKQSAEYDFYIENDQKLNTWISLNYGIRSSVFLNYGPATVYTYNRSKSEVIDSVVYSENELINDYKSLEPRISIRFLLNPKSSIKAAYSYTTQYLHLLSNSSVGLPTDVWLPPDSYFKPQSSHQYVLGYYISFFDNLLDISTEAYYKNLQNIVDYKDNADLFMNEHIETQILSGKGKSYGIEFLLEKKGRISGWLGYSLAKTSYNINGVNNNEDYSPRYDIRHNLTVTSSYKFTGPWLFSSTFKLTSGGFITLPEQIFYIDGAAFFDYGYRNNYRMPPYHRLDLSFIYEPTKNNSRNLKRQWVFSIFNVYSRKNIYTLFVKQQSDNFDLASIYKMYLFRITPSVSYNLKF
jgi:hypothetical protein